MIDFKIIETGMHKIIEMTEKDGTVRYVPFDEANPDYQRYLRWQENPDAEENGTIS